MCAEADRVRNRKLDTGNWNEISLFQWFIPLPCESFQPDYPIQTKLLSL
jgi:hypothetical protein